MEEKEIFWNLYILIDIDENIGFFYPADLFDQEEEIEEDYILEIEIEPDSLKVGDVVILEVGDNGEYFIIPFWDSDRVIGGGEWSLSG